MATSTRMLLIYFLTKLIHPEQTSKLVSEWMVEISNGSTTVCHVPPFLYLEYVVITELEASPGVVNGIKCSASSIILVPDILLGAN